MQDLLQRQRTTFENHRLVCWWKHAPRMQCGGNELGNVDSCLLGFFMFLVCPWFLGQETEIVTRVVWAYSALALAGSLQEQEANHSRLKKLVCWFDWLDTIGHDWSNYLRTKNSIGSIGLFRPEVPPVFGRHCNRRTQDGSRYPIADSSTECKSVVFLPLVWLVFRENWGCRAEARCFLCRLLSRLCDFC